MNQNELVIDITHAFITQVAPEELPLFSRLSQLYRENPENITRPKSGKDDMLGFGMEEVIHILTPLVMTIVTEALTEITGAAVDTFLARCKGAFRRFFRIPPRPQPVPNFTPEQLARIGKAIEQTRGFRSFALSKEQKEILAALVIKTLTTTRP